MALFMEDIDSIVNGLHVRQHSDMCYSITTNPEGNDGMFSAEYPEIALTFITVDEYMLETHGCTTHEQWKLLLDTANKIVEERKNELEHFNSNYD